MDDQKKIKRSISLAPALLAEAQDEADARYGGNLSAYFAALHANARSGAFDTRRSNIIELLASDYFHSQVDQFREALHAPPYEGKIKYDQQIIVRRLLSALLDALKSNTGAPGDFDPEQSLYLADGDDVARWEKLSEERLISAGIAMAKALNQAGAKTLLAIAAEDPAGYADAAEATRRKEDAERKRSEKKGKAKPPAEGKDTSGKPDVKAG